ncbi:hypothetical protein Syun_023676 [Stephania yunnanensis]|uniref:Uncharacterized protein n=1 Tax=Stephania yunnanensis TaxID=152371 RepID=A0AAP0F9D0_9MAGN
MASMGTLKDWAEFKNGYALYGSVSTLDGVGWSAVDTNTDQACYFVHGLPGLAWFWGSDDGSNTL